MAGLLDSLDTDRGVLGMSLLAAAAPQAGPRNTGAGLLSALGNVQQFRDAASKRKADEEEREMRRRQIAMQEQQQMLALQQARDAMARQQTDASALRGLFAPLPGPTQDGAQLRRGLDIPGMLQSGASPQAVQTAAQLDALVNPRAKEPQFKVVGNSLVRIGGDGAASEAYRAPAENKPDDFMRALQAAGIDPNSPQARQLALQRLTKMATHAPASTMNNFGAPVAAIDANGNPVYIQASKGGGAPSVIPGMRPPKSGAEERAEQEQATRARTSQQMLSALGDAEQILKGGRATASGVGNVLDAGARVVGVTTPGAQDAARLEALSGWLVANVPRMEGPQSNFDVQNYMQMAGKVGDRTTPIAERLAALAEVRRLQNKYSNINGTPAAKQPAAGQPSLDDLLKKYGG